MHLELDLLRVLVAEKVLKNLLFYKVMTDDEALINEMRNTVISRNSLRSAHLKRLEETKAHLNEIKNKVSERLVKSRTDLEMPTVETAADIKGSLLRKAQLKTYYLIYLNIFLKN